MRDTKALLLLLLAAGLLGTWIYHLYDKSRYGTRKAEAVLVKDSSAVGSRVRDSLNMMFAQALMDLKNEKRAGDDSLQGQLNTQVTQIYKLRNEISSILKNRNITMADLEVAKGKISELQGKIDEIKQQNSSLEEERGRLNLTLEQLSTEMKDLQESVTRLSLENRDMAETIQEASTFVISNMSLAPIDVRKGLKEVETTQASRTKKFVVSFVVQNNVMKNPETDIVIVIVGPDGNVIQNEVWQSSSFPTKAEGTKNYTIKLNIEYHRGERKLTLLSLDMDKTLKGEYKLQVYHNGVRIGETQKTLS